MSLKYLSRIEEDEDYYINNNYDSVSLRNFLNDLQEAKTKIAEYESRLMMQYNISTRTTTYYRVIADRYKNDYRDKKVSIRVKVESYKMLEGKEVKSTFVYNSFKEFSYQNMTDAILYVYELLGKYPGSIYHNNTPYRKMVI